VDDDAQVRHVLARVIQAHGLSAVEASSGAEALAVLARDGDIPVCISDIYMPEMDGVTFLREAVRSYPDMAVIMLTGVAEVDTAVECLKLGALDYISKPVMVEEVRVRLDKALEKRDLILQNRFYQENLETRVRDLDRSNKMSLINGVQMLVHALEAKDAYTSGHSSRVSRYAADSATTTDEPSGDSATPLAKARSSSSTLTSAPRPRRSSRPVAECSSRSAFQCAMPKRREESVK